MPVIRSNISWVYSG